MAIILFKLINNSSTVSQIFPNRLSTQRSASKNSALARIKEKRAALKALTDDIDQNRVTASST
jgi:hypothetical protein